MPKDDSESQPRGGGGTQAHSVCSTPGTRLGEARLSLHPSSSLRSLLQKHPPSTHRPELGPDSPPPRGLGVREAEPEQTGDTASPCLQKSPVPSSLASPAPLAASAKEQQAGGSRRMVLHSPSVGMGVAGHSAVECSPSPTAQQCLGWCCPAARCRDSGAGSSSPLNQSQEAYPSNSAARRGPNPCLALLEEPNLAVHLTKPGGQRGAPSDCCLAGPPKGLAAAVGEQA